MDESWVLKLVFMILEHFLPVDFLLYTFWIHIQPGRSYFHFWTVTRTSVIFDAMVLQMLWKSVHYFSIRIQDGLSGTLFNTQ